MFVTHLHADHIMDLINVFQGSWPSSRIDVYGPGPAGPPFTTHDDPVHPVRFPEDPAPGIGRVLDHLQPRVRDEHQRQADRRATQ